MSLAAQGKGDVEGYPREYIELKEQLKQKEEELRQMQEQLAKAQTPLCAADQVQSRLPRGERRNLFNSEGDNNWHGIATYQPGLLRTRAQTASSLH